FKIAYGICLMDALMLYKMMGYPLEFFWRGDCRSDGHFPEKLSGIRRDDLGMQMLGDGDGQRGLTDCSRANNGNEDFFSHYLSLNLAHCPNNETLPNHHLGI